jgi:hypothetical protein
MAFGQTMDRRGKSLGVAQGYGEIGLRPMGVRLGGRSAYSRRDGPDMPAITAVVVVALSIIRPGRRIHRR